MQNPEYVSTSYLLSTLALEQKDPSAKDAVDGLNVIFNPLIQEFSDKIKNLRQADLLNICPEGGVPTKVSHSESSKNTTFSLYPPRPISSVEYSFHSNQPEGRPVVNLRYPVGEYGAEIAFAGIAAGRTMNALLRATMKDKCDKATKNHKMLLIMETFQTDTFNTLREAVATNVAVAGLITSSKVEGHTDDPIGLLKTAHEDGIFNELAAINGIGIIMPMVLDGHFLDDLLELGDDDKISLNPKIRESMINTRIKERISQREGSRGYGCPVSRKNIQIKAGEKISKVSGVDIFLGIYLSLVEHYYTNPIDAYETNLLHLTEDLPSIRY